MSPRHPFGWDLPPGVTDRMIDEAAEGYEYDEDDSCPDCGSKGECAPACPSRMPDMLDTPPGATA